VVETVGLESALESMRYGAQRVYRCTECTKRGADAPTAMLSVQSKCNGNLGLKAIGQKDLKMLLRGSERKAKQVLAFDCQPMS